MKIERKILLENSQDGVVYKNKFFLPFENKITIYNLNINQSKCIKERTIVVNDLINYEIRSISISDNGLYVLVINGNSNDNEIYTKIKIFEIATEFIVWECPSIIPHHFINMNHSVTRCIFGKKNEIIVVADNLVICWNFLTNTQIEYYEIKRYIHDIFYSSVSQEIFITNFPSKKVTSLYENKITEFFAHSKTVYNFYCTSKYLIVISDEGIIKIRDLYSKKCLKTLDPILNNFTIRSLLVASNGLHILASVGPKIYVWDIFTGKIIHIFYDIFQSMFSKEHPYLQSISDDGSQIIIQVFNNGMEKGTNLELLTINQRLPLLLYSHKFNNGIIYNLYSDGNITRFYRH